MIFSKMFQLKQYMIKYNIINKYEKIYLKENYFDSKVWFKKFLKIKIFNL